MTNRIDFFKEAIKSLKTSGTITPSSRFLTKRMLSKIDFKTTKLIVELGPGNGAITHKILEKLEPSAILICFEINPNFYQALKKIEHKQLIVIKASAENIDSELLKLGYAKVNHIVSSLPLTLLPQEVSDSILQKSYKVLESNGTFLQYQYSLTYLKKLKNVFKDKIKLEFEPLNLPPAFIYRCKKQV